MTDEGPMDENLASLGMPMHIAKQQLRDDPETHKIAEALGVDVEAYIEQVIFYAQRPQMDAQVQVIPDEELAEMGASAPSLGEVNEWFEAVEQGEIELGGPKVVPETESYTEEKDEQEVLRQAAGVAVQRTAPKPEQLKGEIQVKDDPAGSVLKNQLLRQQQRLRMSKDGRQTARDQKTKRPMRKKEK